VYISIENLNLSSPMSGIFQESDLACFLVAKKEKEQNLVEVHKFLLFLMSCYKRIDEAYLARNHLTQKTDWLLHVKCKQCQRLLVLCAVVELNRTPEKNKSPPKKLPHNKGRRGS